MNIPDLPLARAITSAVLDQIERSRTISSAGIEEVVYAKLVYANAVASEAPPPSGDPELVKAARELVEALVVDPIAKQATGRVADAWSKLNRMLGGRTA